MKDQLDDAAVSTSKALSAARRSRANDQVEEEPKSPASIDDMLADKTKVGEQGDVTLPFLAVK